MNSEIHPPSLLNDEILAFIGLKSPIVNAPDSVEEGAVRRYAQAIMDDDAIFSAQSGRRAPALFPMHMFRRPFGSPDPLAEVQKNPDYDGAIGSSIRGLPDLPFKGKTRLNGGAEIEVFRYADHGDHIKMQSEYIEIKERVSKTGPMLIVIVETRYFTHPEDVILSVRSTALYR
jgi:hypothetical protein